MDASFFAVGWQPPQKGQLVGQVKDFRRVYIKQGLKEFVGQIQFANIPHVQAISLIEKFAQAANGLENLATNGNNLEVPFYRPIDFKKPDNETARISKVTEQLSENLDSLRNYTGIRFYILVAETAEIIYRFYIKALRTAKVGRFTIMNKMDGSFAIMDNKEDLGKVLPYQVSYAETITRANNKVVQYIFNVQDYEDMFGLNELKLLRAKQILAKFLASDGEEPEYKIATEFTVEIPPTELSAIYAKLETNRKWTNKLVKYAGEAADYAWEDVKRANQIAAEFGQVPFSFDEVKNQILLTADTLEAFISVLLNTKKLGIAKNEYEDSLAKKRKAKGS